MAEKLKPRYYITWAKINGTIIPLLCTNEYGLQALTFINVSGIYVRAIARVLYNGYKLPKQGWITSKRVKKLNLE